MPSVVEGGRTNERVLREQELSDGSLSVCRIGAFPKGRPGYFVGGHFKRTDGAADFSQPSVAKDSCVSGAVSGGKRTSQRAVRCLDDVSDGSGLEGLFTQVLDGYRVTGIHPDHVACQKQLRRFVIAEDALVCVLAGAKKDLTCLNILCRVRDFPDESENVGQDSLKAAMKSVGSTRDLDGMTKDQLAAELGVCAAKAKKRYCKSLSKCGKYYLRMRKVMNNPSTKMAIKGNGSEVFNKIVRDFMLNEFFKEGVSVNVPQKESGGADGKRDGVYDCYGFSELWAMVSAVSGEKKPAEASPARKLFRKLKNIFYKVDKSAVGGYGDGKVSASASPRKKVGDAKHRAFLREVLSGNEGAQLQYYKEQNRHAQVTNLGDIGGKHRGGGEYYAHALADARKMTVISGAFNDFMLSSNVAVYQYFLDKFYSCCSKSPNENTPSERFFMMKLATLAGAESAENLQGDLDALKTGRMRVEHLRDRICWKLLKDTCSQHPRV